MGKLSSDSLFHFTCKEAITSILQNGFYVRYSLEEYYLDEGKIEFAVPMVCFCDIPLSQIYEHTIEYGSYAIGMKKEWAIRKGITPVFYIHNNGKAYIRLERAYKYLLMRLSESIKNNTFYFKEDERNALMDINKAIHNTKPIEGISMRTGKVKKFYDEKEWRYYPELYDSQIKLNEIPYRYINYQKDKDQYTKELGNTPLKFNLEDIRYIIVEKDTDRDNIIELLKASDRTYEKYLITQSIQIFSQNQINEDF